MVQLREFLISELLIEILVDSVLVRCQVVPKDGHETVDLRGSDWCVFLDGGHWGILRQIVEWKGNLGLAFNIKCL